MKLTGYRSQRLKLVVLDANFYWTEQLFSACRDFADVLLLRPRDFRSFRRLYGGYFIDMQPRLVSAHVWEQRICCPPGWLFYLWPLVQRFFARLIRRFHGNSPVVFVFSYPYYHTLLQKLNAFSIYYNIDDYRDYWPGRSALTEATEKLAVTQANLTLCVARHRANHLQQTCPSKNDHIVHLPHGCSPEFMVRQPLLGPMPLPEKLQVHPRPVAGYIGALNYRFDFAYLASVAKQLPEVTFVLGGSIPQRGDGDAHWWRGVEAVRCLPNVHFIGQVPHKAIGEYLQSFGVLLMVYSRCNFNTNACPMKLWDYMGTSLPIVANNAVPEVNLWDSLILISKGPDEFAGNIKSALTNPRWKSRERLETAKAHTWAKQAQKLQRVILRRIG